MSEGASTKRTRPYDEAAAPTRCKNSSERRSRFRLSHRQKLIMITVLGYRNISRTDISG